MTIQKTYQYAISSSKGIYMGQLPNVTSDFALNQVINSVGAQLTITVATSTDVAVLPNTQILDEGFQGILDENGIAIFDDGVPDVVGTSNSLISNDNQIVVTEISSYHPNGVVVYEGYISKWKDDDLTDVVTITCLNNSQDLAQTLIPGENALFADQEHLTNNNSTVLPNGTITNFGQTFTVGAGVTNVAAISVAVSGGLNMEMILMSGTPSGSSGQSFPGNPILSTSTQYVSVTGGVYTFVFPSPVAVSPGQVLFFCLAGGGYGIGDDDSGTYSGGSAWGWDSSNNDWLQVGYGHPLYFETFYSTFTTTTTFTDEDVSSVFTTIMQGYNQAGGSVQIPTAGYPATGDLITYSFKVNSVLEGIQKLQSLGPTNYYYYLDPATNILYYKPSNTVADFTLIKGRHINNLAIEATKENIVNNVYFSGGDDGSGLGTSIFVNVSSPTSILANRVGMDRISDNRVAVSTGGLTNAQAVATGTALAQSDINSNNAQTYIATCTIQDGTIDTSMFKLGMMAGFAGFGNYRDTLLLPVVGINYNPNQVVLSLGSLPKRASKVVEQIQTQLADIQSGANPISPT